MTKINFKEFTMFSDISHKETFSIDVREQFADVVYKHSRGVVAHNLAFKILNSEEAIEMKQGEWEVIAPLLELCTPQFQDSFNHNLKKDDEKRDFEWNK